LVRYRVILPKDYDPAKKYGVVYFLHGRTGDRFVLDNIGIYKAFNHHSDQGGNPFIMATLDGGDSYWMNAAHKNERWGDVVTDEFIRAVEQRYRVVGSPAGRILAGISMGGHGAIQNTLNHPGIYGAVAAHSPVFRTQEEAYREFYEQFGTGIDYQNRDPFSLIIYRGKKLEVPLWMDIGGQDFALNNTENFARLVKDRGYRAELHIGEDRWGGHASEYWQYHLPGYLRWYGEHLPLPEY
jgi:S-formylglutathione hydrolase FrmB